MSARKSDGPSKFGNGELAVTLMLAGMLVFGGYAASLEGNDRAAFERDGTRLDADVVETRTVQTGAGSPKETKYLAKVRFEVDGQSVTTEVQIDEKTFDSLHDETETTLTITHHPSDPEDAVATAFNTDEASNAKIMRWCSSPSGPWSRAAAFGRGFPLHANGWGTTKGPCNV